MWSGKEGRRCESVHINAAQADSGAGSRCGAGILGKRGRADGVMPEAGPRVADARWQQPAEIGPYGHQTSSAFHVAGTLDLAWSIGRRTAGRLYFRLILDAASRSLHHQPKT